MPNLDLVAIIKLVILLIVIAALVAVVASTFGSAVGSGTEARDRARSDVLAPDGFPAYIDTPGSELPSAWVIATAVGDSLLGSGQTAAWFALIAGGVVTVILGAIGWRLWQSVVSS